MNSTFRFLVVTGLVLAVAACGLIGTAADDEFEPRQAPELTLSVTNRNFYDATLYAVWSARRHRLGRVSGNGERSFKFRWEHLELRVEINLLSVGSYYTLPIMVEAGDELELVIEAALDKRIRLRRLRP